MRYHYKEFRGCDSCCDIEVHRRSEGKYVFVATEVPDNPGTSGDVRTLLQSRSKSGKIPPRY